MNRGRTPGRDNGREAESYAPLVDLDPHLADAVLDLLANAEIAAYAAPVEDHRPMMHLPSRTMDRPLDRVWSDRGELPRARGLLEENLPRLRADLDAAYAQDADDPGARERGGADRLDEEAAWAEIVRGWDAPAPDPAGGSTAVPRWPVQEDVDDAQDDRGAPGPAPAGRPSPLDPGWAPYVREPQERPAPRDPADDEHFVPPVPPPLPPTDPVTRWAWIALLGAPAGFFLVAVLGLSVPDWLGWAAVAAFVAGFVVLVARMGDKPPRDSGPDDGAVV